MQLVSIVANRIPKRYAVTLLAFIGNFLVAYLQLNLSIVIPEMTSSRNITRGNITETVKAEFAWNSIETGYILSAFSVGSTFSVVGGYIVPKTGGVIIVGVGVIVSAIITIISPFLIRLNFLVFLVSRAVLGCVEGLSFISLMDVFTHWAPPNERARLVTFAYSGAIWSIAVNFPLSGIIINYLNWESLFYISGSLTLIWCVVWLIFVSHKPSTDKYITERERAYLMEQIRYIAEDNDREVVVPWRDIFSSKPVYAILNEMFVASFTGSFLGTCLPIYVNDVFDTDIQSVGFISGLPILCGCFTVPAAGFVADRLRTGFRDVSKVNRLYIFWGEMGTLVFLFIAAIWGNLYGCIACVCFVTMAYSIADSSYQVICIDIAGQFAGTLKALTHITSSAASILNPVIIGYLTPNHSQAEWNIYFGFLGIMTVYGVIMFFIFGSSDLQPWAEGDRTATKNSASLQGDSELDQKECHNQHEYNTHL